MFLKLQKLYPSENFHIGDTIQLFADDMRELYGVNKFKIKSFLYTKSVQDEILIVLDDNLKNNDNIIHPSHMRNLTNLRKEKIKRLLNVYRRY